MIKLPPKGDPLIRKLVLSNVLSFGLDSTVSLDLGKLNILVGPNGSGKSNIIEIIKLLQAAPRDLRSVIQQGGGVAEWIWKGAPKDSANIDTIASNPYGRQPLRHVLSFREEKQTFHIDDERIENEHPYGNEIDSYFYYRYQRGNPIFNIGGTERTLKPETVEPDQSILAQRKDPETYPELFYLGSIYEKIKIYSQWTFGRSAIFRQPQKADMRNDRLEEDFSNLGLFLNRLRGMPKAKKEILKRLGDLYEGFSDFDVSIVGGAVQAFFTEGDFTIPATRLSDGTLRYLCLLAILCDPEPPPLICLEEPELGLHPDILPKMADLLRSASERTQLIVTTHSDILIDAMTETPEAVVVCDKHDGKSEIKRLDVKQLGLWLQEYRLGELWTSGQLGGTRW